MFGAQFLAICSNLDILKYGKSYLNAFLIIILI